MADSTFTIEIDVRGDWGAQIAQQAGVARGAFTGIDGQVDKLEKSLGGASGQTQKLGQNLSTTRYALYDVSRTLTVAGAALTGLAVATSAVAIAWERDFAQVVRTTGVVGESVGKLRADLVDLTQAMPAAFGEITEIATLAGQLGIAEERVASFTATTVKMATVTDLTVDEAATAFGRLDALLPDVKGNYEALGSAIALTGINAVATESQITRISTQISSMGNFAGLTAADVIGLSSALASVGAPPELSRGTVTRLFVQMSKAVAEGGDKLNAFARVAGVSGKEFEAAFGPGGNFGPTLEKFIGGLGSIQDEGGNAVAALNELGISSVRDVPLLLRLAGAQEVVTNAFKDSRQGYAEGTELNRQYGIIAETTAAKIQVLSNNFMAMLDAIGGATVGPIGVVVDHFSSLLEVVTDIVSTEPGQWAAGVSVGIIALVGALALVGGAIAAAFAGIIAMQQALVGLGVPVTTAGIGLKGLAAQLIAVGGAGTIAGRGVQVASVAIKGLGLALAAFAAVEIGSFISKSIGDISYAMQGLERDTGSAYKRLLDIEPELNKFQNIEIVTQKSISDYFQLGDAIGSVQRALAPMSGDTMLRDLVQVDEALADMINNGAPDEARDKLDRLRDSWVKGGSDVSSFKVAYKDATDALRAYTIGQSEANYETARARDEVNLLAAEQEVAETRTAELAAAIGLTAEQFDSFTANIETGSAAFFDWAGNVKAAYEEGGGGITQFMETLDAQIVAQGQWAQDIGVLTAQGATAFASEIAKMGPAGAALAADAVNLTSDELMKLEGQARLAAFLASAEFAAEFTAQTPVMMAAWDAGGIAAVDALIAAQISKAPGAVQAVIDQYNILFDGRPMELEADSSNADQELQRFLNRVNSSSATVSIFYSYPAGGPLQPADSVIRRAGGGPIYGPGTATSDSIPAYLSDGEFVIKAASVQKYGMGLFNALNAGRIPKFASGGAVSSAPAASPMMGGVVELGPKSLARLSQNVTNNIMIDEVGLSRSVERGNRARRFNGEI